jgi:hypothetical protein
MSGRVPGPRADGMLNAPQPGQRASFRALLALAGSAFALTVLSLAVGVGPLPIDAADGVLVFALPTQFFIDPQGRITSIVNGPLNEERATGLIESILPPGSSSAPTASNESSAPAARPAVTPSQTAGPPAPTIRPAIRPPCGIWIHDQRRMDMHRRLRLTHRRIRSFA